MAPLPELPEQNAQEGRAVWLRQSATVPSLHGGKGAWVRLVEELIRQIDDATAVELSLRPIISPSVFAGSASAGGARSSTEPMTWAEYGRFLKFIGFVRVERFGLKLTEEGRRFRAGNSEMEIGIGLSRRFRLFAEVLHFVADEPRTVEEIDDHLRSTYGASWKGLGGTRARLDWLHAIRAAEPGVQRRWVVTSLGTDLAAVAPPLPPQAMTGIAQEDAETIDAAPPGIGRLLAELSAGICRHDERSTYNIWVPSPASQPNKVENLRVIVNAALEPIDKAELLQFIAERFGLRRSSVDSMLPFLRASGLIQEVRLSTYQASEAAQEWLQSGDDVNFVRILHAHMRFVGEMLYAARGGVRRSDIYIQASSHGLNVDKSRWIAAFLQDTGLIEPPRYGSLQTTPRGIALLDELPLAEGDAVGKSSETEELRGASVAAVRSERLDTVARAPLAMDRPAGRAFEDAVRECFADMGFQASSVGGSGATDVLVKWFDSDGDAHVAVVEVKARAAGAISHTDVSDVALETHKVRHNADAVVIVAPGFSGDTIRERAKARDWVLLEAAHLGRVADEVIALGIGPEQAGVLLESAAGDGQLQQAMLRRRRELAVLTFVVQELLQESAESGDAITPRDIFRDGRRSELQPTIEEILAAISTLKWASKDAVRAENENADPRFSSYVVGHIRSAASSMRALADAMEAPLNESA